MTFWEDSAALKNRATELFNLADTILESNREVPLGSSPAFKIAEAVASLRVAAHCLRDHRSA